MRLRKAALSGGVNGLRRFLHADRRQADAGEATLDDMVEAELKRRLVAGELRTGDLTRMQANAIARERLKRDDAGERNGDALEGIRVLQSILELTKPHMVKTDRDPANADAENREIQARFAAQKSIGATALTDDPERCEAALTKMIGDNFTRTKPESGGR